MNPRAVGCVKRSADAPCVCKAYDYDWLGDGFQRVLAARQVGLSEIAAKLRAGTQRDAILFGIGADGAHGLPRNKADKRNAVALFVADPEWRHRPGDRPAHSGWPWVREQDAPQRICG